ncbi:MAG: hypothetical protein R2880_13365 [Deinococcales bacterium]
MADAVLFPTAFDRNQPHASPAALSYEVSADITKQVITGLVPGSTWSLERQSNTLTLKTGVPVNRRCCWRTLHHKITFK